MADKNKTYTISEEDYLKLVMFARLSAERFKDPMDVHNKIEEIHYRVGLKKRPE